ncbi:conserved Plasmodium protein, unknown function [Plasmodium berghei]|uniref:Uncharacterized protein n=2 Tax=Plasmodium berghei TaxID=5821 RepID=A0A509AMQ3_PLABA|nr:conserved Plasmodium protein, unknown function [Plasmodium berghei ANKA]CXI66913.1 conserved Plasmodium protein, unknown function [Plasmodium berghei]SCM24077.1 conserved Plasmodium protein, unknown function [Plasmodium berghei]SCN26914.1 conserved Plasmodium protein, unknown function [Plasmodium berghei]SCO61341.1 conserved Plasmodium protein, unknown function [Plasmodium berghei]SCO63335.1 conserved Plasmodium protein, unknown function [Plasmodium berghei]|eukprot:XP_034422530.1 conserved Plasmodium protein, unknown function [Plasmodium berghei ANKA]
MNSMHKLYQFENKDDDIYINSFFRKNLFRKYEFKSKHYDKPKSDVIKNKSGAHFKRVSNNSWYDTSVYNKEKDIYLLCKEMKNENNSINILSSVEKNEEIKKIVNTYENVQNKMNTKNIYNFKIDKYTDMHNNILKNNQYNSLYMNKKGKNNKLLNIKNNSNIIETNTSRNIENKIYTELIGNINVDKINSNIKDSKGEDEEKENELEEKNKNRKIEKYILKPKNVIKSNLRLKKENITRTSSAYCDYNIEKNYFKKRSKSNIVNCKVLKGKVIQKKWIETFNSEFDINNLDELKNKSIFLNNNTNKFKNIRCLCSKNKKENDWDHLINSSYIYSKYNNKNKYFKSEKMLFPKIENILEMENCNLEQGEEKKKNLKKNNKILTIDNSKNRKISQVFDNKFYQINETVDTNNEYSNKKESSNNLLFDISTPQNDEINFDDYNKKKNDKQIGKESEDLDAIQIESKKKKKEKDNIEKNDISKNKEIYNLMGKIELNEIHKSIKTKNKYYSKQINSNQIINRGISYEIVKKMDESQISIHDYNFNSNDKNIQYPKGNISDNISIDFKIYKPILMNYPTQIIIEIGNKVLKSVYINEYPQTFNVIIQKMNKTNNEQIISKIRNKMNSIKDEDLIKFVYLNDHKEIGYSYICIKNVLKLGMDGGMFILVSNEKKESMNHKHFMHSQIIPINKQEIDILKPKIFMNYKIYCPKLFIDTLPINEIITFNEKIKYLEDMIRQLYAFIQNSYPIKYTKNIINPKEIKARIIYHRSKGLEKNAENIINKKKYQSYKIENLEIRKKSKPPKICKNYDTINEFNQIYEKKKIQNNTYEYLTFSHSNDTQNIEQKKNYNKIKNTNNVYIQIEKELNDTSTNITNKPNNSTYKTNLNNINVKNKENCFDIEVIKKNMNTLPNDKNHKKKPENEIYKTNKNIQNNSDTTKINIQKEICLDEINKSVTDNIYNLSEVKTQKYKTKKEQKNRIILSSKINEISNENKNKIDELCNVIEKLKIELESKNLEISKLKHSNNNINILYKSCYKKMYNHEEKKKKKKVQMFKNNILLSKFNGMYNCEITHENLEKNVLINPSIEKKCYFEKEDEEITKEPYPNVNNIFFSNLNMKEKKINYNGQKEELQSNNHDTDIGNQCIDDVVDTNTTLNEIDVGKGDNTISHKKAKQHLANIENKLIEFEMLLRNNELIKHELNKFSVEDIVNDENSKYDKSDDQNKEPIKNELLLLDVNDSKNNGNKNLGEYEDINYNEEMHEQSIVDNLDNEKCFTNKVKKVNKYDNNIRFNFPLNFVKSCSHNSSPERS